MNQKPLFQRVTIVGLGLIGGSLGMALRRRKLAKQVFGIARRAATLRQARSLGAIDRGSTDLPEGLKGAELVVIATPPESVVPVAKEILRHTRHRLLLTDVASTKAKIVRQLGGILPPRISYVGSHPMAGSEHSGIRWAKSDLFKGTLCLVTPTRRSSPRAVSSVSSFWRALGARVLTLSPERHDAWVAQVSHLPHLASSALALVPESPAFKVAASGFSGMTRLALSNPELWIQICRTNRREILKSLTRYLKTLRRLHRLLTEHKDEHLKAHLRLAQLRRGRFTR